MKRKVVAMLLVVSALSLGGCGSEYQKAYEDFQSEVDKQAAEMQAEADRQAEELLKGSADSTEASPAPEVEETTEPEAETEATEDSSEASAPSSGSYEVDGISVTYYSSVHGDVTGNWRLAVIYDGSALEDYVVDFYKEFVTDDAEVFGIVNLGLKTTARVSEVMPGTLDVSVTEYVDGEEHDADALYSGSELRHFWIDMETGEVDSLEE